MKPALEDDRLPVDPFAKIGKLARPHDAGEPNPMGENHEFEAAVADALARDLPGLASTYALVRWADFAGERSARFPFARTTRLRLGAIQQRRLFWITEKRKVLCDKREGPRLTTFLDSTAGRAPTLAYNADDRPWKARQLSQAVERQVERLAKAGKLRLSLGLHGLRHSCGVELAEAGASDAEMMSQLEHATDRAARIYRHQAERRRLADFGQDKIDTAIALRGQKADGNGP